MSHKSTLLSMFVHRRLGLLIFIAVSESTAGDEAVSFHIYGMGRQHLAGHGPNRNTHDSPECYPYPGLSVVEINPWTVDLPLRTASSRITSHTRENSHKHFRCG
jgi:hypothetical protein